MPVTLDAHRPKGLPPRSRHVLVLLALAILLMLVSARKILQEWVSLLWFDSLGFGKVFWTSLLWKLGLFVSFAFLTFGLLLFVFLALKRAHENDLPRVRSLVLGGQAVQLPVQTMLQTLGWAGSLLIAFFSAVTMGSDWEIFALAWGARKSAVGTTDPIFEHSLRFYLFVLPLLQLLVDWLFTLAIVGCGAAILLLLLTSGSRKVRKQDFAGTSSPWSGLGSALAFLLVLVAANVYLARFGTLFEHHTLFDGVTYTDAHVTIGGLLLVCVALVGGAGIAIAGVVRKAGGRWVALAPVPAAVAYVLLNVVSWYVNGFIVKPNELVRESPYIAHNIEFTRQGFGLDRFTREEFPADSNIASVDASNNQPTLQDIRLWDWHALQDTLRQVQEIRTYYDFPEIDIDRYRMNGAEREVMLAAREFNIDKLPVSSRNWINEKLIYTHGYGMTMNTVNGFTPEGLPNFLLSNMPVQSTQPGLMVLQPQIYFGELTDTDVYVGTRQKEFDFPQGQTNKLTTYHGNSGIRLGNILRRSLIAFDRGDLSKVPFSDDIGAESQLLMRRNLRERVAALAPFLTLDQDPYIVIGDGGKLFWMLDAYTTSDNYPYATHYGFGEGSANYLRNSVKVVVDAYSGSTTFYVFDPGDPVINAYRQLLPSMFRDATEMPSTLREHVRYPELLFKAQAAVYGLYHMTDPEVFFNREDLWTVATESIGTDAEGNQTVHSMEPNYVLMKLPNGPAEEFVQILPFTPANRNNLIGWIAGRCDGADYGKVMVYNFPKTRLVDGPQQIEARIDQNAQLSGQLTLWNQQGSHVLRGSLLVIPTGRALLYAEPIYLQAQQSPMPELRLVVLALQDKLAYAPTFEAALGALLGDGSSSLTQVEPSQKSSFQQAIGSAANTLGGATSVSGLIKEASQDFAEYQRLTAEGKLAEAGQKLDHLKGVLAQLSSTK